MSLLAPLLEIQELDLAADAARHRSESLTERQKLPVLDKALIELESQLTAARAERVERQSEEEQIGRDVSQLARDIEAAEVERYSGKRKDAEEAALHEQSQGLLRETQAKLEERELELLGVIEELENHIAKHESAQHTSREEREAITNVIQKVEAEVDKELSGLAKSRLVLVDKVPGKLLLAYERVRSQSRTAGRGAARLSDDRCTGCRIQLPSMEASHMMSQPQDALIQCPQCRRVLIRDEAV